MELRLQPLVRPTLQLRLTPQLAIALSILQKPLLDLKATVDQAIVDNPFLEADGTPERELSLERLRETLHETWGDEPRDSTDPSALDTLQEQRDYYLSLVSVPRSLREDLLEQFHVAVTSPVDLSIGEAIIDSLTPDGYLATPVEEIAQSLGVPTEAVTQVLTVVQSFEPVGVGAQSLQECLLIQLRVQGQEGTLAWRVVNECWEDLGKRRFDRIARRIGGSLEEARQVVQQIATLNPKPGSLLTTTVPQAIVPDVVVKRVGEELVIECCDGYLPSIRINPEYHRLLCGMAGRDGVYSQLKRQLTEAVWFLEALKARETTLSRVAQALVKLQAPFFQRGPATLRPMTAKALARTLDLHESTLSRAIAGKYIATPFGLFPMKALFARKVVSAVGKQRILNDQLKEAIRELIAQEDPAQPLSDQAIAASLHGKGISVARRTLTKYREALGLLPAHLRRR